MRGVRFSPPWCISIHSIGSDRASTSNSPQVQKLLCAIDVAFHSLFMISRYLLSYSGDTRFARVRKGAIPPCFRVPNLQSAKGAEHLNFMTCRVLRMFASLHLQGCDCFQLSYPLLPDLVTSATKLHERGNNDGLKNTSSSNGAAGIFLYP